MRTHTRKEDEGVSEQVRKLHSLILGLFFIFMNTEPGPPPHVDSQGGLAPEFSWGRLYLRASLRCVREGKQEKVTTV